MSQDTPVQEPDPVPVPEAVPEGAPEGVREAAAEPAPYKPRRRGRTTLLIAAAAVLGVVAGGGLGYRIQENREPTALPPLTGPVLAQPKGAGPAAQKLTAGQDGALLYQGSLLKLLMPTPKSGKEATRGWVPLLDFADDYTGADHMFINFATNSFQRAAHAEWSDKHGDFYEVELAQFRDEGYAWVPDFFADQQTVNNNVSEDGRAQDLTDVQHGTVWASGKPRRKSGYLPEYEGRGIASIGNIYVQVYVDSLHPVKAKTVKSVLEKQLERL